MGSAELQRQLQAVRSEIEALNKRKVELVGEETSLLGIQDTHEERGVSTPKVAHLRPMAEIHPPFPTVGHDEFGNKEFVNKEYALGEGLVRFILKHFTSIGDIRNFLQAFHVPKEVVLSALDVGIVRDLVQMNPDNSLLIAHFWNPSIVDPSVVREVLFLKPQLFFNSILDLSERQKNSDFMRVVRSLGLESFLMFHQESKRSDPAVIQAVLSRCPDLFFDFPESVQNSVFARTLALLSAAKKNDRDLCNRLIAYDRSHKSSCLTQFSENPYQVVQQLFSTRKISPEFLHDKNVVRAFLAVRGEALSSCSDALKADKDVVLAAVSQNGLTLRYASAALQEDKDVIAAASH